MWVSAEESHRKESNYIEFVVQTFHTYPQVTEETIANIRRSQWVKSRISAGHGRNNHEYSWVMEETVVDA
jgi:hypothetical protein